MKMYVDELPKKCADCPFYKLDTYVDVYGYQTNSHECVLDGSMLTNSCPLQSLADHTKQVRKEVLGELMNMLGDRAELIQTAKNESTFMFDTYDLSMCVEEILGEEVKENEK